MARCPLPTVGNTMTLKRIKNYTNGKMAKTVFFFIFKPHFMNSELPEKELQYSWKKETILICARGNMRVFAVYDGLW